MQPWEYGAIPRAWYDPMRCGADEVWVYSSWNQQCYIEAGIPAYEILVAGEVPAGLGDDVEVVAMREAARAGRPGEMRNELCRRARFETLVVADDDMRFHADFTEGLAQRGDGFDLLSVRLLNPDGTRYWDWAIFGPRQRRQEHDRAVPADGGGRVARRRFGTRGGEYDSYSPPRVVFAARCRVAPDGLRQIDRVADVPALVRHSDLLREAALQVQRERTLQVRGRRFDAPAGKGDDRQNRDL